MPENVNTGVKVWAGNLLPMRQTMSAATPDWEDRALRLTELFEKTSGFMAVLRGPKYVFEFANAAYLKMVGSLDIIGKPLVEALPDLKDQIIFELLDHVLASGESYSAARKMFHLKLGPNGAFEERFLDFVYQPLCDADGKVDGIFIEGHDVTDQKRVEDALHLSQRRKDEFLATLAHELRNPLAPIRHAATVSQAPDASAAEQNWAREVIDRQVGFMGRLLDDLTDVSRINNGKLEIRKERLSLNESLLAAVNMARPLIEARGHVLTLDLLPTPVDIEADPIRIEQIFSNLLTNAAKYTDRGGLITVQARQVADYVEVIIADNGIGISAESLPGLFDIFSQTNSSRGRSEGGLGIGLSLVRGLLVLHGGNIFASSRGMGKGSEFVTTLPIMSADEASVAQAVKPIPVQSNPTRLRVLVVDDNQDNADLCSMLFKKAGHEVRTAYCGKEALAIAAVYDPQFVLLDIGMPVMNGYEVARQMRARPGAGKMVLIAVTGWGQQEDVADAVAAGFDHHITKPFAFKILRELMAQFENGK